MTAEHRIKTLQDLKKYKSVSNLKLFRDLFERGTGNIHELEGASDEQIAELNHLRRSLQHNGAEKPKASLF